MTRLIPSHSRLFAALACTALLVACRQDPAPEPAGDAAPAQGAAPASAEDAAATTALAWGKSVAWDGDLNACRQGTEAATRECLLDAMRSGGASQEAVTAASQLSSAGELAYVSAWHEQDGIGVATATWPFRANTNQGTRLIDAKGQRIDVDADPLAGDAAADPAVQALAAAHPGAAPFPPAQAAGTSPLEGGGISLLYRTPLRECHACADVAHVQQAYDFDAQRTFIGSRVVP